MATKEEALDEYCQIIEALRSEAEQDGITSAQFDKLLSETLEEVKREIHPPMSILKIAKRWILRILKLLTVFLFVYALVSCHTPTQKSLSRHVQGYIYPFMRTLRKLTLPILHKYPELAGT